MSKTVCHFAIILILKGIITSKGLCFLLNRNITLIKTKWNRKRKLPRTVLERQTLCFSSHKNRKLKVKLLWLGARERKRGHFLYGLFYPKKTFLTFVFYVYVQCIEDTFRIYILLLIKKIYFIHFFACLWNRLKSSVYHEAIDSEFINTVFIL